MNHNVNRSKMKSPLFLSASLLAFAVGHASAQPAPAPAKAPAKASAPAPAPAPAKAAFQALVTADQDATLSAQMAGRIKKINYGIGQPFGAGAVLAQFDCEESQAKLDALNAEYLGARETHLAKLRLQGLGAAGDLEVTLTAAAGEKAKSQVRQQEAQMAYCSIRAPYAGRIVRLKAKQAESVAPNQPIMEIVAAAQLKATLNVPSSASASLKAGTPLTIEIKETGRSYSAKVTRLNARLDAVSQSLEVEAVFVGKTVGLLPGMIGQATLP
jgi:membrane fusion protein (multidrug efflux system)